MVRRHKPWWVRVPRPVVIAVAVVVTWVALWPLAVIRLLIEFADDLTDDLRMRAYTWPEPHSVADIARHIDNQRRMYGVDPTTRRDATQREEWP